MNYTTIECDIGNNDEPFYNLLRVLFYSLVIIISIFGNTAIIYCVYKTKTMQTFTNTLICNSAVADLLITLVPTVHEVLNILSYKGEWKLGGFMCSFLYMCVYLSVAASILTLVIITIDRFFAVVLPHKKYLKISHLKIVIPTIWLVAFLFSTPTIFIQKVIWFEGQNVCVEQWSEPFNPGESPKHYTVILFVFLYATPLSLMGFLYAVIAVKLIGASRGLTRRQKPKKSQSRITGMKHKKRVIKMLLAVVISFGVCWLPVYIIQIFHFLSPDIHSLPSSNAIMDNIFSVFNAIL